MHRCYRTITEHSRWHVVLSSGSVWPVGLWDSGATFVDTVLCLRISGRRFCTGRRETSTSNFNLRLPVTFASSDLSGTVVELWDYDGSELFDGCEDSLCAAFDRSDKKRVPLTHGEEDRVDLTPSMDSPYNFFDLRHEGASALINVVLDELN